MSITLSIIILTCLVSFTALQSQDQFYKLSMSPYQVKHQRQYYRMITSGLIHADFMHLGFNMLSLYFFSSVEDIYVMRFGSKYYFLLMYVAALLVSSVPSLLKHRDNPSYQSVGASGAVSAVIFSGILFFPWSGISFFFIDIIRFPAVIFGAVYIWVSVYLDGKGGGRIAHDAHYWGAVFGLLFPVLLEPVIGMEFINAIRYDFPGIDKYIGSRRRY
ncbi:rhomboid family intramembrane serine protease [Chitinophaga horti]|uniref:Rhomboid family intramembrane serine protease n=1 Tax=Chitinophaga horti TaxID=2920382 RepID=A0ABY6J672_9BACT|nr:rhomboid family intramembrane serine protease [Chitinophaga horti]UYQ95180.1 rhomboid family intramembrane serine protease [Chitinophaga horti]